MIGLAALARLRRACVVALLLAAPLSACVSVNDVAGPPPAFDVDKDIREFNARYSSAMSVASYYQQGESRARRDEFVSGRLTLYNLQYIKFIQGFALSRAQLQSAFDITNLSLGVANSLVGGQTDHAALAAATTLLGGSRLAIDKNFFAEQTAPALISQMNAGRQAALVPILKGLKKEPADYPLSQALVDLQAYYEAGTIQGALMDVQVAASAKKAKADRDVEALRTVAYTADDLSERLVHWLRPTGVSESADGVLLDAAGAPAPEDRQRLAALRQWLAGKGLAGLATEALLDGPMAGLRGEAVGALGVP